MRDIEILALISRYFPELDPIPYFDIKESLISIFETHDKSFKGHDITSDLILRNPELKDSHIKFFINADRMVAMYPAIYHSISCPSDIMKFARDPPTIKQNNARFSAKAIGNRLLEDGLKLCIAGYYPDNKVVLLDKVPDDKIIMNTNTYRKLHSSLSEISYGVL